MKICLVSVSPTSPYRFHRKYLGLGYIHAYALLDSALMQRVSIEHECYDLAGVTPEDLADQLQSLAYDLVGFSCFLWNTPLILDTAVHLKKRQSKIKIILGGPEANADPGMIFAKTQPLTLFPWGRVKKLFMRC